MFWFSAAGGFLPAVLLEILGAAIASATVQRERPDRRHPRGAAGWVSVPYLSSRSSRCFAVNTLNLYSSGLTLQAAGLRLARWHCVLVDTAICTALCFLVIFSNQFNTYYSDFLGILIIWLCPWFAIYAVDALLRRQRYDAPSLVDTSSRSRYWRNGGFFLPGIIAQVLGMAAAAMWISSTAFRGPLSAAAGGSTSASSPASVSAASFTGCWLGGP